MSTTAGTSATSFCRDLELRAQHRPELLDGVTVVVGRAKAIGEDGEVKNVDFTAVPYYAWDNRAPGEMVVWLPEDASLAEAGGI